MRTTNPIEERIVELIEPAAQDLGYRLVRIRLSGMRRKRLQIMAERLEDGGMGVDDCEALSRAISPVLDASDPISAEYDLEVSSPGIDRPLMRIEDFERFVGHEAKLETVGMSDGRKRFRGAITGVEGGNIRLAAPEGDFVVPFSALSSARLVLTDRLIEEDLRRSKKTDRELPQEEASPKNEKKRKAP